MQTAACMPEKCDVRLIDEQDFADSTYQNECTQLGGKAQIEIDGQEGDGQQQQAADHQYQPQAAHPRATGFSLKQDMVDQVEEAHAQHHPHRADGYIKAQQSVGRKRQEGLRIKVVEEAEGEQAHAHRGLQDEDAAAMERLVVVCVEDGVVAFALKELSHRTDQVVPAVADDEGTHEEQEEEQARDNVVVAKAEGH